MPEFKLEETSGLPLWMQLRNRFIYLIKVGYYRPGEQLPSVRGLAAELSINYNTVSKAYVDLESAGYVTSVRGRGVFVSEASEDVKEDMVAAADAILEDAIKRCVYMGMSLDEVKLRMMDVAHNMNPHPGMKTCTRKTDGKSGEDAGDESLDAMMAWMKNN